jgi:hypothetical protein
LRSASYSPRFLRSTSLLLKVLYARAALARLLDISGIEPSFSSAAVMNFSNDPLVKLRSLLLTALMRVPSTAMSSPAASGDA